MQRPSSSTCVQSPMKVSRCSRVRLAMVSDVKNVGLIVLIRAMCPPFGVGWVGSCVEPFACFADGGSLLSDEVSSFAPPGFEVVQTEGCFSWPESFSPPGVWLAPLVVERPVVEVGAFGAEAHTRTPMRSGSSGCVRSVVVYGPYVLPSMRTQ